MKKKLQEEVKSAMKARDKVRVDTIRGLLSAIQYEEIEKKIEPLPDEAVLGVVQREVKKRKEEIEFAEQAKRDDLKERLFSELKTLESFLPSQLSPAEIERFLSEAKSAGTVANMGTAMKLLKEKHAGQYDSKSASEVAKRLFG